MARRNRRPHALEQLIKAPWWFSLIIGAAGWLLLFAGIPAVLYINPGFDPMASMSKSLSWLPAAFFAIVAVISFVQTRKAARQKPSLDVREEPTIKKVRRRAVPQIVIDQDMHTVLALGGNTQSESDWTIESLCVLEWKRFELLCAKYYEAIGFKATTLEAGADGGIDIKLYRQNMDVPMAIVQCKSWKSQVPVSEVRELFGVMAHEKVARGIFITTGSYTRDALMFGAANPIQLLDGETFLQKIRELNPAAREALKAFAFAGDYTTPTCASCGIKLVKRENRRGAFWGCVNYPRCHMTMKIRASAL